jgi:N-formylglutamate deformylase
MEVMTLHQGTAPLLISLPHDGSALPGELAKRMTETARAAPDTDWFVSRLYSFASELGASILIPAYSRYVVDLNRPPDDVSLYPGQNTTGLCPIVQFSGEPVYLEGEQPSEAEVARRVERYWRPYHDALQAELERLRALHGRVLLWEGHSIKSRVPFLFEGRLPDINLGTASGASCNAATQLRIERILSSQSDYSWVSNGRFKGGYITRHYGAPKKGVHAIQLEMAQAIYMTEGPPFTFRADLAAKVTSTIRSMIKAVLGTM